MYEKQIATDKERTAARRRKIISTVILFVAIPALIFLFWYMGNRKYYICGTLMMVLSIGAFWMRYEKSRPQPRQIVVLAVLSAIAVASRAVFIMFPQFKPMAGIVMICAMAFGPGAGFVTGTVSVFASNFIFGQGPWTVWQMFAFGTAGFLAGVLADRKIIGPDKRWRTVIIGGLIVQFILGPILDTATMFTMAGVIDTTSVGAMYLAGVPFNFVHAAATMLILLVLTRPLMEKLNRLKMKYGMGDDL